MAKIVGRYFSFQGRVARLPFFARGLYLGVVTLALSLVGIPFFAQGGLLWWVGIVIVTASLALLAVGFVSLTVRRQHDLGLSGYHAIWVGAAQAAWTPLSYAPPKVMLAGLPLAAIGVWLTSGPATTGETGLTRTVARIDRSEIQRGSVVVYVGRGLAA